MQITCGLCCLALCKWCRNQSQWVIWQNHTCIGLDTMQMTFPLHQHQALTLLTWGDCQAINFNSERLHTLCLQLMEAFCSYAHDFWRRLQVKRVNGCMLSGNNLNEETSELQRMPSRPRAQTWTGSWILRSFHHEGNQISKGCSTRTRLDYTSNFVYSENLFFSDSSILEVCVFRQKSVHHSFLFTPPLNHKRC